MTGLSDSFQRPINYLRLSVTDRCNLRCIYCMPEEGVPQLSHREILSYEEIRTVVAAAARLGISKVRVTGGEPLVRAGLPGLIKILAEITEIDDISLTTNGILLAKYAAELKQAGLRRVNVSLDTLHPDRFRSIARRGNIGDVLRGIEAARAAGLHPVKINTVVIGGINDDELLDFAARTIKDGWNVRFIELMPLLGEGISRQFISVGEIKKRIQVLGELEPCSVSAGNGPAKYFRLPGAAGTIGFITPVSEHFCFNCNRLRLTADGKLRPCLLRDQEIDVKQTLRQGSPAELEKLIREAIMSKPQGHTLAAGAVPRNRPYSQVGG